MEAHEEGPEGDRAEEAFRELVAYLKATSNGNDLYGVWGRKNGPSV